MAESSDQPQKPRKKSKWRRLAWALLILLLLVIVIAVVVQIVLWTNIPRRVVIGQVEKNLGLRINASSLSTGWLGHTELHDVDLGLPLSDKAFLKVPTMKVHTNTLFGLALGNGLAVKAIELDRPTLYVVQDQAGQWNLAEVAKLVAAALGEKPAEAKSKSSAPSVPNVKIVDGTIIVVDQRQRTATIQPLELNGYAETPLSWAYDVRIQPDPNLPPRVGIKGRLVPGGMWQHEVEVGIQNIADWIKPWDASPPAFYLAVTWQGQMSTAGIGGRLDVQKFQFGPTEAYGTLTASRTGGEVRINPSNLLIKTQQHLVPQVKLTSGSLVYNGSELRLEQLLLNIFGGAVKVDGLVNPKAHTGELSAQWRELALAKAVKSNGSFHLAASAPLPNEAIVDAQINASGTAASGPWETRVAFDAKGTSFSDLDWKADVPLLQWHRTIPFKLDGLALAGGLHPKQEQDKKVPQLTLKSIGFPIPNLLSGHGEYTFDKDENWSLHVEGRNWKFRPLKDSLLSFVFDGHGDHILAHLDNLGLQFADTTVSLNGTYTYGIPKPVKAALTLTNVQPVNPETGVQRAAMLLRGTVQGNAALEGELVPLDLTIKGTLSGREVDVLKYHIGQVVMTVDGNVDSDKAAIHTNQLRLLGGDWQLAGTYMLDTDDIDLGLSIKNLALHDAAAVANVEDVSGTFDSELDVHVPGLRFDPNSIAINAKGGLHAVHAMGFTLLDQASFAASLSEGQIKVDPIHIRRENGQGTITVAGDVNNPYRLDTSIKITKWPLDLAAAKLHADVTVNIPELRIELPRKPSAKPKVLQIPGPSPAVAASSGSKQPTDAQEATLRAYGHRVDISGAATLDGKPLGDLEVYAGVWERVLDVRAIHLHMLGGRADGQARLDFGHFTTSTAEITWENLDTTVLTTFYPELKDMGGTMTGNLRLAPSEVNRPLEPLAFVLKNSFINGHWRNIPVYDATIIGYIGKDSLDPQGGYRVVLGSGDHQTSTIHLDDGVVRLWGRIGRHANSTMAVQANVSIDRLDLDTAVHAFDKTAAAMPGRLTGDFTALYATPMPQRYEALYAFPAQGPTIKPTTRTTGPSTTQAATRAIAAATEPASHSAEYEKFLSPLVLDGDVKLSDANLGNFSVVAGLYNMMHAGVGLDKPIGTGDVRFHLERGTFHVNHLRYFNRGVEVRATATATHVWDLPDNPITGVAVGTLQPLKVKKLPLLADINDILAAIQRDLTTVAISGDVRKPKITPMFFGDAGGEFRRFIAGDVNSELGTNGQ